ncbi:MAG: hypothetical protein HY043_22955 [Verrucomicrobia bacterium]|nr:hypothetical protein [Verrucomicrobiota bacterium]
MGLFKKKPDQVSKRARQLNAEIAALEARIKKLSSASNEGAGASTASAAPKPPPPNISPAEPIFENVDQHRLKNETEAANSQSRLSGTDLGSFDPVMIWRRIQDFFRGPPPANPKLVNYLAAGGIHGLRPLRYEKRVARYRLLFLVGCLLFALWIIIALWRRL